jgi:hypothetical protein
MIDENLKKLKQLASKWDFELGQLHRVGDGNGGRDRRCQAQAETKRDCLWDLRHVIATWESRG